MTAEIRCGLESGRDTHVKRRFAMFGRVSLSKIIQKTPSSVFPGWMFLPAKLDGCQVILDKSRSIVIGLYSFEKRRWQDVLAEWVPGKRCFQWSSLMFFVTECRLLLVISYIFYYYVVYLAY